MSTDWSRTVAIVDYGMGNLYSVFRACEVLHLRAEITGRADHVMAAPAIILPGVGAMPRAMAALVGSGLDHALRSVIDGGKPFFGICLGLQLLMEEGGEFEPHQGLGVIAGRVEKISWQGECGQVLRVPHIGWNGVQPVCDAKSSWSGTPMEPVRPGQHFYFVHSFVANPTSPEVVVATTRYGEREFCAALRQDNVFACQFHPERSGSGGLAMLNWFAETVANQCDQLTWRSA